MPSESTPQSAQPHSSKAHGPRAPRWLWCASAVLATAMVGAGAWHALPKRTDCYSDGNGLRVARDAARVRDVLWRDPVALPAPLNLGDEVYEPALAPDGSALFFVRGRAGGGADIYVATRSGASWSEPVSLAEVNSPADDLGPRLSADGCTLYYYSDRPGGFGGFDLWTSKRPTNESPFAPPVNLGPRINTIWDEYGAAPAPAGEGLYFASNRPTGDVGAHTEDRWSATLRADREVRTYDLYHAAVTSTGFAAVSPLTSLNTAFDEGSPAISPAGDFLYFSSNRPGGAGGYDLYRARLGAQGFGDVEQLGERVNTAAHELDPALAMDGFALYFSSNRADGVDEPSAHARNYRIFQTTSREVFVETQTVRAGFDWSALARVLGPGLLGLLLLLALLLFLRTLTDTVLRRRLSLLARCLLASLLLHGLLLALFTVWQVSTSPTGLFRRMGGVRVALSSPAKGAQLVTQVRGGFVKSVKLTATPHDIHPPRAKLADAAPALALPLAPIELPAQIERIPHESLPTEFPAHSTPRDQPPAPLPGELSTADLEKPPETMGRHAPEPTPSPAWPDLDAMPAPPVTHPPPPAAADFNLSAPEVARVSDMAYADATPLSDLNALTTASDFATRAMPEHSRELTELPKLSLRIPERNTAPARSSDSEPALEPLPESTENVAPVRADFRAHLHAELPQTVNAPPLSAITDLVLHLPPESPTHAWSASEAPTDAPTTTLVDALASESWQIEELLPGGDTRPTAVEESQYAPLTVTKEALSPPTPTHQPNIAAGDLPHSPKIPNAAASLKLTESIDAAAPMSIAPIIPAPAPPPAPPLPELADGLLPIPDLAILKRSNDSRLTGEVTDAHTSAPLAGANVHLDLSHGAAVSARTSAAGEYALAIPPVPEFFVISASAEGYVPASANIAADAVRGRDLSVHFRLRRADLNTVAIEAIPEVHHLGDDQFTGAVNSQFQKRSEGASYLSTFDLSEVQIAPYVRRAELVMLTRGVQMRHILVINEARLDARLTHSPPDGSFGEFRTTLDVSLLRAGANHLEIHAMSRGSDVDDFEFVNVQIHLHP